MQQQFQSALRKQTRDHSVMSGRPATSQLLNFSLSTSSLNQNVHTRSEGSPLLCQTLERPAKPVQTRFPQRVDTLYEKSSQSVIAYMFALLADYADFSRWGRNGAKKRRLVK